jgi:hypothetical protein
VHERGGVCIEEQAEPGCTEPISFSVLPRRGRHAQLISVLGVLRAPIMTSQPQLGLAGGGDCTTQKAGRAKDKNKTLPPASVYNNHPCLHFFVFLETSPGEIRHTERFSMDPFSITAGAIGITGVATTSIAQLHTLINGLSEAQDVVTDVASTLANIERPLAALEQLIISDEAASIGAREDLKKTGVAEAVNKCGDACSDFSKNLTKWTRHSTTKKLSLRDRLSVGVWNKEKIRTFRMQLRSCEATVHFAVTSTQL